MKKKVLLATIALSVCLIAEARPFRFWVFASGNAQDSNRDSAVSEAYDNATQQANAICTGTIIQTERTGTSCLGGSDGVDYTCMVFVKGLCEVQLPR